jgi:hypothetical protein
MVHSSNLPPCLQAPGKMPLNDIDEDVIFGVGHTPSASTTSSSLTFRVHDHSPNLDPDLDRAKKSGSRSGPGENLIGWPANQSKFFAQSRSGPKKRPVNDLDSINLDFVKFFAKKGKKKQKNKLRRAATMVR